MSRGGWAVPLPPGYDGYKPAPAVPRALAWLFGAFLLLIIAAGACSCDAFLPPPESPKVKDCRAKYIKCADEARTWDEYDACERKIDAECLPEEK